MIYKLVFIPKTSMQTQETRQKYQLSPVATVAQVTVQSFPTQQRHELESGRWQLLLLFTVYLRKRRK